MSRTSRPPLRVAFRALQNANYRAFYLGQLASLTGTWMQRIALAWLVLQITDSPLALGAVNAIQFAPILAFSLVGGAMADRFPQRRVQFVTQSVMLGWAGRLRPVGVGSFVAALGVAYAGKPTRQTLFIGAVAFSVLLVGVGASTWLPLTVALLAGLGFASIIFQSTANTRLQLVAPDHLRGRVMSLYSLLFAGTTPIGSLVLGTAAEHVGVQATVVGAAAACLLGVALAVAYARRAAALLVPDTDAATAGAAHAD